MDKKASSSSDIKPPIADAFHAVRTSITLIHPIAPNSCEMVREYLNINEQLWNWDYIFNPIYTFIEDSATHKLKYLEPHVDFFEKHESQISI